MHGVVKGLCLAFVFAGACLPAPAAAATLDGVVVQVDGKRIEILVEGPSLPVRGDTAEVVFRSFSGEASTLGTWRVSRILENRVFAVAARSVEEVWPGMSVRIESPSPRPREAPVFEDPWFEKLLEEAEAIGPPVPPLARAAQPTGAAEETGAGGQAPTALDDRANGGSRGTGAGDQAATGSTSQAPAAGGQTAAGLPPRSESGVDAGPSPGADDGSGTGGAVSPDPWLDRVRDTFGTVIGDLDPIFTVDEPTPEEPAAETQTSDGTAPGTATGDGAPGTADAGSAASPQQEPSEPTGDAAGDSAAGAGGAAGAAGTTGARDDGAGAGGQRPEEDTPTESAGGGDTGTSSQDSGRGPQTAATVPTGRSSAETEPNDTPEGATRIDIGTTVSASILPRGDGDLYIVELTHQGELTARFSKVPAEIDIAFRILNEAGAQVWGWQGAKANGQVFEAWADIKVPGSYVIEVRDGLNNAASPEVYTLTPLFIPTADTGELNDRKEDATAIDWNQQIAANILPRGDGDLYGLDLDKQGELQVRFTAVPPEIDIAFRVLNEDGAQVWGWQGAPASGEDFEAWADIKTPGRYLVEVRDGLNNARSPQPYRMTAQLVATADPAEPNDVKEDATPLAWQDTVRGNILPRGDGDLYALDLAKQGEITISFSEVPPEVDIAFRVLNANGTQHWGWQGATETGQPFEAWADIKTPGTYLLEVRDGLNNARSAEPYAVLATLKPTADPAEPNDEPKDATPLGLGQTVRANILPRADGDLYRITLGRPGRLTVRFTESPQDLDMAFRVRNADGTQAWGWQGAEETGQVFEAHADLKAAGTYLIEVRDGLNNARSAEPYTMQVGFQ